MLITHECGENNESPQCMQIWNGGIRWRMDGLAFSIALLCAETCGIGYRLQNVYIASNSNVEVDFILRAFSTSMRGNVSVDLTYGI
jgi:hypothetical protein